MKLSRKDHRMEITLEDGTAVYIVREPEIPELNEFLGMRFKDPLLARIALFDKTVIGCETPPEVDGVPADMDHKDLIPPMWKASIIVQLFEQYRIDEKN